ncbi:glycosyltransferase family 2 protein [bacterium]|nr:MAG: glycosyltransferase family 2 protein [bacterium]
MKNLTLIVLTKNEAIHLKRCLGSVGDLASQIIVVDCGSTDETIDIAKKFNADILTHPFVNQAEQFNWALDNTNIKGEWVLKLDADEYLTPELMDEIEALANIPNDVSGFYMKRRVHFMGRWIKHGGYYPRWFLRIFRKGKGRSESKQMDEHLVLSGGKAERLKNDFIDENLKGLAEWTVRHGNYSDREAREAIAGESLNSKRVFYYRLPPFLRVFLYFFYRYFLRLGFLDGKAGLIFHFLQGFWYRFLVDAKIYELRKKSR